MIERLKHSRASQVLKAYGESHAGNYAAGLALNAFLAMFPLILGILAVVGLVVHDPGLQAKLNESVASIFPSDAHQQILSALGGVKKTAGILGIVALLGLLWSGTSLFASMEFALTQVFGSQQRDALRQRLMGLVMVLVFVAAVLVTVVANSAAAVSVGAGIAGSIIGALVLIGLLVAIYRFVPNRTFAIREIWPGALLAGILIEVFSLAFPLYARISHGFNTYGQQFALFFLLATWLTFLSQFILLGAVFNRVRLGEPEDSGILAAPSDESREVKRPVDAVEEQQGVREAELTGRSVGRGAPVAHPTAREARIALGVGAVAAGIGAVMGRARRR